MIEASWENDEILGYGQLTYTKVELPNSIDPKESSTTVLSYSGCLKDSRLDGKGTLVT